MGKKRKVKNKELTQEEIWDDSALIQSWDEAVEEYKLYHSIHARGENVEDVLREVAAGKLEAGEVEYEDGQETYLAGDNNDIPGQEEAEDGEVQEDEYTPMDTYSRVPQPYVIGDTTSTAQPPQEAGNGGTPTIRESAKEGTSVPQALLGGVKDEGMKNLMMAWYYAGYYTGLHEGQQQANRQ